MADAFVLVPEENQNYFPNSARLPGFGQFPTEQPTGFYVCKQ